MKLETIMCSVCRTAPATGEAKDDRGRNVDICSRCRDLSSAPAHVCLCGAGVVTMCVCDPDHQTPGKEAT